MKPVVVVLICVIQISFCWRKHSNFDLMNLKRPARKNQMFLPLIPIIAKLPKIPQVKFFMMPDLLGGEINIKLPRIKNPIVMNDFPTYQYISQKPANEVDGSSLINRKLCEN